MKIKLVGLALVCIAFCSTSSAAALHFADPRPNLPAPASIDAIEAPELIADPAAGAQAPLPTFFYVATAVDVNGLESANSNETSATLKKGMTKGVTVTWTAPVVGTGQAAIAGFNVYRGNATGGPYTKQNSALITGGVTTYVDPFVSPNAPSGTAASVN